MADPAGLEQLAVRLEQSGDYRILRRVPVLTRYADDDPAALKRLGLIVDIETTGLDPVSARIIELACLQSRSARSESSASLNADQKLVLISPMRSSILCSSRFFCFTKLLGAITTSNRSPGGDPAIRISRGRTP